MFFCEHDVDEENKLQRLFWTDSIFRIDYKNFLDVLIFYATFWTNVYKKLLVVIEGYIIIS